MSATEISTAERPTVWRPCPTCWGQRRIFEDRNGEGLVPQTCRACLGIGEELVTRASARMRTVSVRRSPTTRRNQ